MRHLFSTASKNIFHRTTTISSSYTRAATATTSYPFSQYFLHLSLKQKTSPRNHSSSFTAFKMVNIKEFVEKTIEENDVVVFSKSYCPYCSKTKKKFQDLKLDATVLELDERDDGDDIQSALASITGQRTVPSIFIKQKHIGGNSDLQKLSDKDILSKANL